MMIVMEFQELHLWLSVFHNNYVTESNKTSIPHTSYYSTSSTCNLAIWDAIDLKISPDIFISLQV